MSLYEALFTELVLVITLTKTHKKLNKFDEK